MYSKKEIALSIVVFIAIIVFMAFVLVSFVQCVHIHGWDWIAYCTSNGAGK